MDFFNRYSPAPINELASRFHQHRKLAKFYFSTMVDVKCVLWFLQ